MDKKEIVKYIIENYNRNISSEMLTTLRGKWECEELNWLGIIVNNYKTNIIKFYDTKKSKLSKSKELSLSADYDGTLLLRDSNLDAVYKISFNSEENLAIEECETNQSRMYRHISDNTVVPDVMKPLQEPRIGMTEQELIESAWGYPKKKNKTTTAYGVKEQWVYDRPFNSKAYIYN